MNLLFKAIENNNLSQLNQLLSTGISLNIVDEYGYSPLHIASFKGFNDLGILLINNGIDVNIKDKNGQTILHYAALNNQFDLARMSLLKGALLTIEDAYGNQPLWTAVFNDKGKNDRLEIVKLFLEYGADANHKNKVGKSPKDIIFIAGYDNLKELIS